MWRESRATSGLRSGVGSFHSRFRLAPTALVLRCPLMLPSGLTFGICVKTAFMLALSCLPLQCHTILFFFFSCYRQEKPFCNQLHISAARSSAAGTSQNGARCTCNAMHVLLQQQRVAWNLSFASVVLHVQKTYIYNWPTKRALADRSDPVAHKQPHIANHKTSKQSNRSTESC